AQQEPRAAARRWGHPAHPDPLSAAAAQRQGRALPANAEARVGPRAELPLERTPGPGAVTLAALLQRAPTAQLARRPITDQPRPQRPEAGHLDRQDHSTALRPL